MLVFDTSALPARERADAVTSAMLDATLSTTLRHHSPDGVRLRLEQWQLGAVELVHVQTSGMRMSRGPKQADGHARPVLAITLEQCGGGRQEQNGDAVDAQAGRLGVVELTRPYVSEVPPGTDGWSIKVPADQLGLPLELVARARPRLTSSPVHDVLREHLSGLVRHAEELQSSAASGMVGAATVDLTRALVASAAEDATYAGEALADTLLLRVKGYVRAHLRDPNLQPAAIAAVHHVSVRHLYKVCAQADLRLEQWIISERLERARAELALPAGSGRTIAMTALRWGFSNSSHFTHRFKSAYGLTPREWQRLCATTR